MSLFGGPTLLPALASAWCPEYPDEAAFQGSCDDVASDTEEPEAPPPYHDVAHSPASPPYATLTSRQVVRSNSSTPSTSSSLINAISSTVIQTALHEAAVIASFGLFQAGTLAKGITDLVKSGAGRPSWNAGMHLGLHFVRSNMAFQGVSVSRVRFWSGVAGASALPSGVGLKSVSFTVDRDLLLTYEDRGAEYRKGKKAGQYPTVPIETRGDWEAANRTYDLDGEWLEAVTPVVPTAAPIPVQSTSWMASLLGGSSSSSPVTPVEQVPTPPPKRSQIIYYLHGGAYITGSPKLYRLLTGRLAKELDTKLFALRYRIAPESPFPAALHDAFAGYLYLIDPHNAAFRHLDPTHDPIDPMDIVIMGDSAGGGLALCLLNYLNLYLRSAAGELLVPMPGAGVLLSPWVDLTFTSHSWRSNDRFDWLPSAARNIHTPIAPAVPHPVQMLLYGEHCTASKQHRAAMSQVVSEKTVPDDTTITEDAVETFVRHPLVSPIFAETLKGLPPILVQAGEAEVLRDDSLALAYRYDADNVGKEGCTGWIRHELYPDMVHVFVAMKWLKESATAIGRINTFLAEVAAGKPRPPVDGEDNDVLVDSHVGI
ncbi:hypothetical protein HKX48_006184 [Thoreauomyces humboldtii]|nr:hypothetical protein HKX48_006184 [Thoreauomyces humboldtii]